MGKKKMSSLIVAILVCLTVINLLGVECLVSASTNYGLNVGLFSEEFEGLSINQGTGDTALSAGKMSISRTQMAVMSENGTIKLSSAAGGNAEIKNTSSLIPYSDGNVTIASDIFVPDQMTDVDISLKLKRIYHQTENSAAVAYSPKEMEVFKISNGMIGSVNIPTGQWITFTTTIDYTAGTYMVDMTANGVTTNVISSAAISVSAMLNGFDNFSIIYSAAQTSSERYILLDNIQIQGMSTNVKTKLPYDILIGENFDNKTSANAGNGYYNAGSLLFRGIKAGTSIEDDPAGTRGKVLKGISTSAVTDGALQVYMGYDLTDRYLQKLNNRKYYIMESDVYIPSATTAGTINWVTKNNAILSIDQNGIFTSPIGTIPNTIKMPYDKWFTIRIINDKTMSNAITNAAWTIQMQTETETITLLDNVVNTSWNSNFAYGFPFIRMAFVNLGVSAPFYFDNIGVYETTKSAHPDIQLTLSGDKSVGSTLMLQSNATAVNPSITPVSYKWMKSDAKNAYTSSATVIEGEILDSYTVKDTDRNNFITSAVEFKNELSGWPNYVNSISPAPSNFIESLPYSLSFDNYTSSALIPVATNTVYEDNVIKAIMSSSLKGTIVDGKNGNALQISGTPSIGNEDPVYFWFENAQYFGSLNENIIRLSADYYLDQALETGCAPYIYMESGTAINGATTSRILNCTLENFDFPIGEWFTIEILMYVPDRTITVNLIKNDGQKLVYTDKLIISNEISGILKTYGLRKIRMGINGVPHSTIPFSIKADNITVEKLKSWIDTPAFSVTDSVVSAKSTIADYNGGSKTAELILATYENDKLVNCQIQKGILNESKMVEISTQINRSNGQIVKAFLWDGFDNMIPCGKTNIIN